MGGIFGIKKSKKKKMDIFDIDEETMKLKLDGSRG